MFTRDDDGALLEHLVWAAEIESFEGVWEAVLVRAIFQAFQFVAVELRAGAQEIAAPVWGGRRWPSL